MLIIRNATVITGVGRVQIQDTPGYGDDLNLELNIGRVKQYIIDQNQAWLRLENSASRGELNSKVDPRVDICLFCLPPHRVRNIDMLFMWEISQVHPSLAAHMQPIASTMNIVLGMSCLCMLHTYHVLPCCECNMKQADQLLPTDVYELY